jgi:hypothetical protein
MLMRRTILSMLLLLSVLLLLSTSAVAAERPVNAADAKQLFARFTAMAGNWHAASTKGWTETNSYEVAAKGSAVINRSHFEGEPNDGMMTTFYLDGDRLLLTHYCEAGNEPTLAAALIDDGGARVVFRFVNGTNMQSRDVGHMDSVEFRFVDADHVRSRWSWYAKGQERWFEEIEQVRVKPPAP